jgi:hypothetical protein
MAGAAGVAVADGFLGRWSRRKLDAKEGRPLEEPLRERPSLQPTPASGSGSESGETAPAPSEPAPPSPLGGEGRGQGPAAAEPQQPAELSPTLADVADLTPASDFRRFIARDVAPDVKSAAMKKLFADPHFNVMDGLDTYIDDYSRPDPIPAPMLRELASARFLGLFRDEERKGTTPAGASPPTDELGPESVAQSDAPGEVAATEVRAAPPDDSGTDAASDAHADLRLQQDDAPEGGEPGRGAG